MLSSLELDLYLDAMPENFPNIDSVFGFFDDEDYESDWDEDDDFSPLDFH